MGDTARAPRFIAVEGTIGVGKTTLTRRLAQTFGCELLLEGAADNPFLERFYREPRHYALQTQLFFLFQRVEQLRTVRQDDLFETVRVSDFMLAKDRLFASLTLDADEFRLYDAIWQRVVDEPPKPDLVIWLHAPVDVLKERIARRGIACEQAIAPDYLAALSDGYARLFAGYRDSPLLVVDAAEIDLVGSDGDYSRLVSLILSHREGRLDLPARPAPR